MQKQNQIEEDTSTTKVCLCSQFDILLILASHSFHYAVENVARSLFSWKSVFNIFGTSLGRKIRIYPWAWIQTSILNHCGRCFAHLRSSNMALKQTMVLSSWKNCVAWMSFLQETLEIKPRQRTSTLSPLSSTSPSKNGSQITCAHKNGVLQETSPLGLGSNLTPPGIAHLTSFE